LNAAILKIDYENVTKCKEKELKRSSNPIDEGMGTFLLFVI
jgi:hypothetical protein